MDTKIIKIPNENLDDYLKTKISSDAGWLKAGKARRESVNVSFFIIYYFSYWRHINN